MRYHPQAPLYAAVLAAFGLSGCGEDVPKSEGFTARTPPMTPVAPPAVVKSTLDDLLPKSYQPLLDMSATEAYDYLKQFAIKIPGIKKEIEMRDDHEVMAVIDGSPFVELLGISDTSPILYAAVTYSDKDVIPKSMLQKKSTKDTPARMLKFTIEYNYGSLDSNREIYIERRRRKKEQVAHTLQERLGQPTYVENVPVWLNRLPILAAVYTFGPAVRLDYLVAKLENWEQPPPEVAPVSHEELDLGTPEKALEYFIQCQRNGDAKGIRAVISDEFNRFANEDNVLTKDNSFYFLPGKTIMEFRRLRPDEVKVIYEREKLKTSDGFYSRPEYLYLAKRGDKWILIHGFSESKHVQERREKFRR